MRARIRQASVHALLLLLLAASPGASAQVTSSEKISLLEGSWIRDPQRTLPDACGTFVGPPPGQVRTITFPEESVRIDTDAYGGEFPLNGGTVTVIGGRRGNISMDAGWLSVMMVRQRSDGGNHVLREVYIVRGDELTVWRSLTVNLPDGTQGKIDCGNRAAIVYRRAPKGPPR